MATASFVRNWGERSELSEARTELPPRLELPKPEVVDGLNDEVFRGALEELGLEELKPVYREGAFHIEAPEGYKLVVTGAFALWPDGSDFDWAYGPPADSYEMWRLQNKDELEALESQGMSREAAEKQFMEDDWDTPHWITEPPNIEFFSGPSLTLSYNGLNWGAAVDPNRERRHSSDDDPAHVSVKLAGYRTIWHEQAARFIQLPNSGTDRMLTTHLYGQPGVIPCWRGAHAEGRIRNIKVDIVPVEEDDGVSYEAPEERLWFPDKVRWSLYEQYPHLVDQMGDHASRSDQGWAVRMIGEIGAAFSGSSTNPIDTLATKTDMAVIDNPIFAHMNHDKLVVLVEELIEQHNNKPPTLDDRADERKLKIEEDREKLRKQLVVITGVAGAVHQAVREFGESDQWLEDHVTYLNGFV